jgi:CubicO group peptidase (beta-lactamase class C family)
MAALRLVGICGWVGACVSAPEVQDPGNGDPWEDSGDPDDYYPEPPEEYWKVQEALEAGVRIGDLPAYEFVLASGGYVNYHAIGGGYPRRTAVPLDAAIQPVTSAVVLFTVAEGALALDDTLGEVLGWTGEPGTVRIRDLLTFTSGFPADAPCVPQPPRLEYGQLVIPPNPNSLADCAEQIRSAGLSAPPGTTFVYGPTHHVVLAHAVEVATGEPWQTTFDRAVRQPLEIGERALGYANDGGATSGIGRAEALAQVYDVLAQDGGLYARYRGAPSLLRKRLAEGLFRDNTGLEGVTVASSPWRVVGVDPHFGQGLWIECVRYDDPDTCIWFATGTYGTTVRIDPYYGYVGALVLYQGNERGDLDGYRWMKKLVPLIRDPRW